MKEWIELTDEHLRTKTQDELVRIIRKLEEELYNSVTYAMANLQMNKKIPLSQLLQANLKIGKESLS